MSNWVRSGIGATAVLVIAGSILTSRVASASLAPSPGGARAGGAADGSAAAGTGGSGAAGGPAGGAMVSGPVGGAGGGTWSAPQPLRPAPGLDSASSDIGTLSCGSPGNCAAGGSVTDAGGVPQAVVADEVDGRWQAPRVVPGTAALNTGGYAEVTAVSCWSPGNCAAGGDYLVPVAFSRSSTRAFVVTEVNGTWGTAQPVPGIAPSPLGSVVTSVSCTADGTCVAGGNDDATGASRGFVTTEGSGPWSTAYDIPGLGGLVQVSCGATGSCGAISGDQVATSMGGSWGSAGHLALGDGLSASGEVSYESISCPGAGDCAVGGRYGAAHANDAVVADERRGSWGPVTVLGGLASQGGPAAIESVSCSGPGDCAAGGGYVTHGKGLAFVATETAGTWGSPSVVAGLPLEAGVDPRVSAVSCPPGPGGDCAYAGEWGSQLPAATTSGVFLGDESDGTPGPAQIVAGGTAGSLRALSCPAPGLCAAGGQGGPAPGAAFVLREATPTTTSLAIVGGLAAPAPGGAAAAKTARASVMVTSGNGGIPDGQVQLVEGSNAICAITLTGGAGQCLLSAAVLRPGATLLARYLGSGEFFGSTSPRLVIG